MPARIVWHKRLNFVFDRMNIIERLFYYDFAVRFTVGMTLRRISLVLCAHLKIYNEGIRCFEGFSRCVKVGALAVFIQCVICFSESCGDWMILMEGAWPGLIAVRVVESKYTGCCSCVDSASCARGTVTIKGLVVYVNCILGLFLVFLFH